MIAAFAAVVCLATPAVIPVEARVVDWFRRPACPRCAGNRGLEFATTPGTVVHAPLAGAVTFSGTVGGIAYVVISDAAGSGINAVIGGLGERGAREGDRVVAGEVIGRSSGWLFVGMRLGPRRDAAYLDPAPLFGWVRRPARLVAPGSVPVSLARRSGLRVLPNPTEQQRHCSVLPPVVASARGPGP